MLIESVMSAVLAAQFKTRRSARPNVSSCASSIFTSHESTRLRHHDEAERARATSMLILFFDACRDATALEALCHKPHVHHIVRRHLTEWLPRGCAAQASMINFLSLIAKSLAALGIIKP